MKSSEPLQPLRPVRLFKASHYHQRAGVHPGGHVIAPGRERVELVTGGRGWIWHDDVWHEVTAGDLLWNCAGDQTIGRSDFDDPYRCLALHYLVPEDGIRPAPHRSRWDDLVSVRAFTQRVVRDAVDERFEPELISGYAYSVLRYRAQAHQHRQHMTSLPRPLASAVELIESDYAKDLSIERLAEVAGWSVPHLHAAFKQHLAVTPHQHLIRRRLRVARELLTSTHEPVALVARHSGFSDAAHFSRAFRQAVGQTPSAYRRYHTEPDVVD